MRTSLLAVIPLIAFARELTGDHILIIALRINTESIRLLSNKRAVVVVSAGQDYRGLLLVAGRF